MHTSLLNQNSSAYNRFLQPNHSIVHPQIAQKNDDVVVDFQYNNDKPCDCDYCRDRYYYCSTYGTRRVVSRIPLYVCFAFTLLTVLFMLLSMFVYVECHTDSDCVSTTSYTCTNGVCLCTLTCPNDCPLPASNLPDPYLWTAVACFIVTILAFAWSGTPATLTKTE